jgi:hypothetical protein
MSERFQLKRTFTETVVGVTRMLTDTESLERLDLVLLLPLRLGLDD